MILKGIAIGMDKITLLLNFSSDEVGNVILDKNILDNSEFDLDSIINEDAYRKFLSLWVHL